MSVERAWNALPRALRASLASGTTVVTPNKRLARRLAALHDHAQRAAGRAVWVAASVVPWNAWLERLWLDALASGSVSDPPRLLTSTHTAHLWSRIVTREAPALIDQRGAAELAIDAWKLVHGWGAGGPSWRAWSGGDDDCAAFARWADDYLRDLARAKGLDAAQLPDWLAAIAPGVAVWRGADVTLAGFIEITPQQQRLLDALAAAGMRVRHETTVLDTAGVTWRATGATPQDEVVRALRWARERAIADPFATIAVAIEDFASRTAEVRAVADEVLCPALQWPGNEAAPRPYTLSLGIPATDVPLIAAALDLIAILHAPLPMVRAAALLRSPYVSTVPEGWLRRAGLERDWICEGRREISIDDALSSLAVVDRDLFEHWRRASESRRLPVTASARDWVEAWRAWLAAAGWPGARPLSSSEWQARASWDDLLAQFATLSAVAPSLPSGEAIRSLVGLVQAQVFQQESSPARVQIMGILEAAGLPVDALWVAGLAAEQWPPAPQPNPLLALSWQRERRVPRSTALRELEYGEVLIAQWMRGAPEVVFSHARSTDDHVRSPSSLLPNSPPLPELPASPFTPVAQYVSAPVHETIADDRAPPLASGTTLKGGAGLIEAQSDCPFRAMALYRFRAEPRVAPAEGLSAMERGKLVHAALAAFWQGVHGHTQLIALSAAELALRIEAAAATAIKTVAAARWRRIPAVVRAGEVERIAAIISAWLDLHERRRPPFIVIETEARRHLALSGLELDLRVDRIDALENGSVAIIDYKTGLASAPSKWFDARPQAPQLGLYVLAQQAFAPRPPVRAAAYAQLKPGDVRVHGIAADKNVWPALRSPADVGAPELPDWLAVEARWTQSLGALAAEVREGYAAVTPRNALITCRNCGMQPLCRIGALALGDRAEDADG